MDGSAPTERARNYVQACFQQIDLDARRTGGSLSSSTEPKPFVDQGKVAAVLEAWTVLNPTVVYTQGLNEVTAMLLLRNRGDESQTMQELQQLVAPEVLGGLWSAGMPLYEAGRQQLRPLAAEKVPALMARLESACLDDSAYLPQAWHSLFSKWLPIELGVAAVDDLLEHGITAVLAITIAVLQEVEPDMLQALERPGAEALEVLVGPEGLFTRLRALLGGRGPRLRAAWRALQESPDVIAAAAAGYSYAMSGGGQGLSDSMAGLVQQEAVLRLATSASKRWEERLEVVMKNVNCAQQRATRDELVGNHDFIFKLAVVGDRGTGKSSIIYRATVGAGEATGQPTTGVDYASKSMRVCGKRVKLQIWDFSGGNSFMSVTRSYLHDIACVLLVYDVCCRESFEGVQDWLEEIRNNAQNPHLFVLLVGNKLDLPQARAVAEAEARALAAARGLAGFSECSARRGDRVEALFERAATIVHGLLEGAGGQPLQGVRLSDGSRASASRRMEGCRKACVLL